MSCLLCSSTRLRRASSASKAFVGRTGSPHPFHRRGCGVGLRRESPKGAQQQQQQYSSSQASIGAVVGCDRVFCGVVRDAVGFKKFFDGAIRPAHPVEKVDFSRRDVLIGLLYRKNWDRTGTFSTQCKNARFGTDPTA